MQAVCDAHTYDEVNGELVNQLDAVTSEKDSKHTRILIAHFPEQIDEYLKGNFDIVLSGHAHGGQWRIPGLIDGVFAPGQGVFSKCLIHFCLNFGVHFNRLLLFFSIFQIHKTYCFFILNVL